MLDRATPATIEVILTWGVGVSASVLAAASVHPGGRFALGDGAGLRRNPALEGRVEVKFEIGERGAVVAANDDGSTLPDPQVRACIVRAVYALTFAPPHAGRVKVTYPVELKPDP